MFVNVDFKICRPQSLPLPRGAWQEEALRIAANSYCPANFKRKAFLPQIFKRSCAQIWCTVTGGAYLSTRRVTMCVRSNYKIDASLNRTRSTHQTHPSAPFSPPSFPARRKRWGRRRQDQSAKLHAILPTTQHRPAMQNAWPGGRQFFLIPQVQREERGFLPPVPRRGGGRGCCAARCGAHRGPHARDGQASGKPRLPRPWWPWTPFPSARP